MKIHYSVFIVLIIALYTNSLVEFTIFFGCIIAHELGHLFFIVLFKQRINCLNITIFGGQLDCYLQKLSIIKNLLINIGGILINIIIINCVHMFPYEYQPLVKNYNCLLIIFNVLPIYPLDGYRIEETLLVILNNPSKEFLIVSNVSMFLVIVLLIIGIYVQSFGIILIAIYLIIKNKERIKERDHIVLRKFIKLFS